MRQAREGFVKKQDFALFVFFASFAVKCLRPDFYANLPLKENS